MSLGSRLIHPAPPTPSWEPLAYRPVYAQSLSHVQLFVTPGTVALQAPLSMGILQARILEWVAMPSSRGSSQPKDQTQVSHTAGRFFTIWATRAYREERRLVEKTFYFLSVSGTSFLNQAFCLESLEALRPNSSLRAPTFFFSVTFLHHFPTPTPCHAPRGFRSECHLPAWKGAALTLLLLNHLVHLVLWRILFLSRFPKFKNCMVAGAHSMSLLCVTRGKHGTECLPGVGQVQVHDVLELASTSSWKLIAKSSGNLWTVCSHFCSLMWPIMKGFTP